MENFEELRKMGIEELPEFLKSLENEDVDYNTCCDIVSKAGLASMHVFGSKLNITGFQAGYIMWQMIYNWLFETNKDNMLYPQYEEMFQKSIPVSAWKSLQAEACVLLETNKGVDVVREHWQSIVDGKVPFGYTIKEDYIRKCIMFKYRVLGSKITGNGKRLYTVLNMTNSETFTVYGKFFREQGDSEFINLRVHGSSYNVLKKDKIIENNKEVKTVKSNLVLRRDA